LHEDPFRRHEVHSAEWAGLKSRKNGELLRAAEAAGYDVLLTSDQGLPYQNNFTDRRISVLAIRAKTNQIEDLIPLVERILNVLKGLRPGEIRRVG
jgi:alkanesulfonate monooxygenase SsuD/methylene tetrahydromethanopterin reductase-like flavin-dependent oxidoreductase (luciferase family)